MPKVVQWLIFVLLTALYVWLVFFFPQMRTEAKVETPLNPKTSWAVPEAPDIADEPAMEWVDEINAVQEDSSSMQASVVEVPEETPTETETVVSSEGSWAYYVISGSYQLEAKAQKAREAYEDQGIASEVIFSDPYFKVVVGKAQDLAHAKSLLVDVQNRGISAFIQRN